MKIFQIISIFLILSCSTYAQSGSCIDSRYIAAIKYFQSNDSVKIAIKKSMGKDALNYVVSDTIVSSHIHGFFYRTEIPSSGISESDQKLIDSLNNPHDLNAPSRIINGLKLFSIAKKSDFELQLSPITKNTLEIALYAWHLHFPEGSVRIGDLSGIYMVFLFNDDNSIKMVKWHYIQFEHSAVFLTDKKDNK